MTETNDTSFFSTGSLPESATRDVKVVTGSEVISTSSPRQEGRSVLIVHSSGSKTVFVSLDTQAIRRQKMIEKVNRAIRKQEKG